MYIQDAKERLTQVHNTIRDLCEDMDAVDRIETEAGRDFTRAPAYVAKQIRAEALAAERIKLLRVIEGE